MNLLLTQAMRADSLPYKIMDAGLSIEKSPSNTALPK
jgi:hypothetical protein